ncbi:hypothetical protein SAMN05518855_1016106 [Paenibacillus sp. CF384]|nr:hypothetical protein SAMN05518855_1016106 [Paenibacillus sp. CF384]
MDIEGYHIHAEGEAFTQLQAEAWEKAREAINAGQPVFAKNIDISNQSSVILAYDDQGYYTDNWHTGYEHSDDVIPWNQLGLSLCPCINCVHDRESSDTQTADSTSGLISLHRATSIPVARENQAALKEALEFVIQLNEIGSYRWSGKTYFVGSHAYDRWLTALESQQLDKYFFSLFVEIITEARHHAAQFLSEIRASMTNLNLSCLDQLILTYTEIAAKGKVLKDMYPYTEPRTQTLEQSEQCAVLLIELQALESKALIALRELHSSL